MRIAQVAPLYESVPPKFYGGTERVVSHLTDELVRDGHKVTLFASGDSATCARLVPICFRGLRLDRTCVDPLTHHIRMLDQVFSSADRFDLIHFHIDYLHFPLARRWSGAHVTTLHGRLDLPDLEPLFNSFQEMPVVSISNAQREPLPWLNWQATVHHGLPAGRYRLQPEPGRYLAFLGRISPEKRVDRAVEIARRAGMELKIAAKVDPVDRDYFDARIRPLLKERHVDYIGEISDNEKNEFLGNAFALLFPIDWPEPFGLVMIEAMACGTPVIAFRGGSVPEILTEGVSGFIVESLDDAVRAVEKTASLSRGKCREAFDQRFTVSRMARDYVRVYQQLVRSASLLPAPLPTAVPENGPPISESAWPRPADSVGPIVR